MGTKPGSTAREASAFKHWNLSDSVLTFLEMGVNSYYCMLAKTPPRLILDRFYHKSPFCLQKIERKTT